MSSVHRPSSRRPNIILINCDDLGYGDLGCYGSTVNDTPTLDRMASEGIRFTDFYMASPVCSSSRGAMLTGCYPPRIGFGEFEGKVVLFPGQPVGLNPGEATIARLLKQVGYSTKLVGKWHCGDQPEFLPTRHGFDSYYGLPYSNDMGRQHEQDTYPPLPLLRDEEVIQEQPDQAGLIERYVEECVRFIRENAGRPFFLYLAHMQVHLPLYAPSRFLRESRNGRYGASVPEDRVVDGIDIWSMISSGDSSARSPREVFYYYAQNRLEAVRDRRWKLHVHKWDTPVRELYDLQADPGETNNVYDSFPEVVRELSDRLDECRLDIGDELTGTAGRNTRPIGRVERSDTLTHYDPDHPYIVALYDLRDRG